LKSESTIDDKILYTIMVFKMFNKPSVLSTKNQTDTRFHAHSLLSIFIYLLLTTRTGAAPRFCRRGTILWAQQS